MENFGLVLSGGGAKGAYQIGALKALKNFENKITIKAISGSSIGGINAAAFLSISLEQIESLWKQFTFQDFFHIDDNLIDGLASRQALISLLNKIIDENKLQKAIPCFNTICIDEYNPEYKLINNKCKKEIIEILLATSALPVIYSKVNINNNFYQDGGIADNLPIAPLYRNEIKNFICISLSENLRIDRSKYNLNNLIEIYPSYSLGDLLDGTLNFSPTHINFCMELGFYDSQRVLNNYFGINNGCHTKEYDYEQIKLKLHTEKILKNVNKNIDYIRNFENKY